MPQEPDKNEEPGQKPRASGALTAAAIVLGCVVVFFLIDRIAGGLYETLPDGLQKFLIVIGVLLVVFIWLGSLFDRIARDRARIRREARAAKERGTENQTGQADTSGKREAKAEEIGPGSHS